MATVTAEVVQTPEAVVDVDRGASSRVADAIEWGLLGIGVVLMFARTPQITGDGFLRFEMLTRLLREGVLGEGKYSLVGPLFATPLWYLGRALEDMVWLARFNQCVLVAGLVAFFFLLRGPLGLSVTRKFLLLLVAASMFPRYVQDFYGEVFTMVLVGAGLLALARGMAKSGIVAVAVGAANVRATLVGLGMATLAHVWHTRRLRYLVLVALGAALVLGETWIRHGDPLANPYSGDAGFPTLLPFSGKPGFSYPFAFGLVSLLLSFGKGIVFFAPGILLWPRASDLRDCPEVRHAFRLWLGFTIGLVLVYSKWWAWYGGWCWGPRFLLIAAIPGSLALALALDQLRRASQGRRMLTLAVLALSIWVAVSAAAFDMKTLAIGQIENYRYEAFCWYLPEFSVLWHPFVSKDTNWASYYLPIIYGVAVLLALGLPGIVLLVRQQGAKCVEWTQSLRGFRP